MRIVKKICEIQYEYQYFYDLIVEYAEQYACAI